ncbi:MAG: hypothetical protein BGP01_00755 [Paludibacter sp. 47-17]|nr:MAG: hypothetical protein ABS72_00795 [Paludibacter sp. SCN 50-10]ODU59896.1 MAG: hypothetical protein ABT12_01115 [Paludibacter sp. SCN 51-9]OJX87383.1 MAG: hypothetical protein BGP01_00755 [Paludibacter sp. 47-17]
MQFFKNDTLIPARVKRREAAILLVCFVLAVILNITGIVIYDTSWKELFTQLPVVMAITGVVYLITAIVRLLVALIGKLRK